MYTPVNEHFLRTGDGKEAIQAPTPSFDPNPMMALHQAGLTLAAILPHLPSKYQDSERPHHTTLHRTARHQQLHSNPSSVSEPTVSGENKIEP